MNRSISIPVGVVVRRLPAVTRWTKWSWRIAAVLPGAPPARWHELRREGDAVEFHVGTADLTLWRTDAEAYKINLADTPSVYVVMREAQEGDWPYDLHLVTVNPHEGAQYAESGEEIVEKVPMPPGLQAWVEAFTDDHYVETPFIKRKRDKRRGQDAVAGIGDERIAQLADVYRTPASRKRRLN